MLLRCATFLSQYSSKKPNQPKSLESPQREKKAKELATATGLTVGTCLGASISVAVAGTVTAIQAANADKTLGFNAGIVGGTVGSLGGIAATISVSGLDRVDAASIAAGGAALGLVASFIVVPIVGTVIGLGFGFTSACFTVGSAIGSAVVAKNMYTCGSKFRTFMQKEAAKNQDVFLSK